MSWVVVISNKIFLKNSCPTVWNHVWYLGVYSSSQGAACAEAELQVPLRTAVGDGDVLLADKRKANKAWCVDRQELFLHLTSQLLKDEHTWTSRPGLWERDVCTLLLSKSILGLPGWIRAGYQGSGDIRPACMLRLVNSKSFLDSGVRRCCKVGNSCVRKVIDCSSVPYKMARRSVARAIRAVSRLGGPGCEIFDTSQLRCARQCVSRAGHTASAVWLEVCGCHVLRWSYHCRY